MPENIKSIAENSGADKSLDDQFDELYENTLYSAPFVEETLLISKLLSFSAEQIETDSKIFKQVASAISYENIYDDIIVLAHGGQRGGAELEDIDATISQAETTAVPINESVGNAILDAEATSEALIDAASDIIKWKIAETSGKDVVETIMKKGVNPDEQTDIKETILQHVDSQKNKANTQFDAERELLQSQPKKIPTEDELRQIAMEAAAVRRAKMKVMEEYFIAHNLSKKTSEIRASTQLESVKKTTISARTLKRQHSLGAGVTTSTGKKGKEAGGARSSALKSIESTPNTLRALYISKDKWDTPFKCYICGTDIYELKNAHFEHTFDFFSAMSKKLVYFEGEKDNEKMIQRCLGEWAHAYCNSIAKSNIDLTNNFRLGINRAGWGDLQADETKIKALLINIWFFKPNIDESPSLEAEYFSLADFLSKRIPYVKARINMSCVITKEFVDWNKYQTIKKIISLSVKDWIKKGKPTGTQLEDKLRTILNISTYNPLKVDKLLFIPSPVQRLMQEPVMYFNRKNEPTEQSVQVLSDDIAFHPDKLENTHGGQIMIGLGYESIINIDDDELIEGGRRKKRYRGKSRRVVRSKIRRTRRRRVRGHRS